MALLSVYPVGHTFEEPIDLTLASVFNPKINVSGWYASPKIDGLRVIWTGKELYTRTGKRLFAPTFFTSSLPLSPLDCELFHPKGYPFLSSLPLRKSLQKDLEADQTNQLSSANVNSPKHWLSMTLYILDAPALNLHFKQRAALLSSFMASSQSLFLSLLPSKLVTENLKEANDLIGLFGELVPGVEGVVLKNPMSIYEKKRGWSWIKVKPFHDFEVVLKKLGKTSTGRHFIEVEVPSSENDSPSKIQIMSGLDSEIAKQLSALLAKDQNPQITVRSHNSSEISCKNLIFHRIPNNK